MDTFFLTVWFLEAFLALTPRRSLFSIHQSLLGIEIIVQKCLRKHTGGLLMLRQRGYTLKEYTLETHTKVLWHQKITPKARKVDKLCHRDRENRGLKPADERVRVCMCVSVFESVPSRPESAGNFLEMQSLTALPRGRPNKPQMCSRICPPPPLSASTSKDYRNTWEWRREG